MSRSMCFRCDRGNSRSASCLTIRRKRVTFMRRAPTFDKYLTFGTWTSWWMREESDQSSISSGWRTLEAISMWRCFSLIWRLLKWIQTLSKELALLLFLSIENKIKTCFGNGLGKDFRQTPRKSLFRRTLSLSSLLIVSMWPPRPKAFRNWFQ